MMRSAPSVSFDIVPSRIARLCFGVVAALAAVSVWLAAIAMPAQMLLSASLSILLGAGWFSLRSVKVRRAVLQSDGVWLLQSPQREIAAELCASSVLGALTGLHWRDSATGRSLAVLLWPDSIAPTARRQLRVWLRSGRAHVKDQIDPDSAG